LQIAETPELATLHALDHAIELTFRSIVAAHPGLDNEDAPYWVIKPSRSQCAASHLLAAASHLQQRIEQYRAVLDLDRQTHADRFDDDLPF
jgi:hypothetical protein